MKDKVMTYKTISDDGMHTVYIDCSCIGAEHVLRITSDDDSGMDGDNIIEPFFYIDNQINMRHHFLKRCWIAFKYAFNLWPMTRVWDGTMLSINDANKLCDELLRFKKNHEKFMSNQSKQAGVCE